MSEWDCNTFLKSTLERIRKKAIENCNHLQAFSNLPHMEPRLHQLYLETYEITLLGFPNASLIMQGILLEALLKEIIYANEKIEFHGAFGAAIVYCEKQGYITDRDELSYLTEFKDKIRNKYIHVDIPEITKGSSVKGWKIPVDKEDIMGSLVKKIQDIHDGQAEPPQTIKSDKIRPVDFILKQATDEGIYVEQYLQAAWFVRMMASKHFLVE